MSTTAAANSLSLNANWLDTNTITNTAASGDCTTSVVYNGNWAYPWYYQPYTITTWPSTRIRLTMTEVERLRTAAKKDKKLRDTLAKFTECIEVVVDFGEDR